MLFFCLVIFLFSYFFVFSVNTSYAASCDPSQYPKEEGSLWKTIKNCRDCGVCTLNDFARIAVNIANWILGIVGSLALLFFIYGGVMFLISGGSSERVTKAKQIIVGAVLGLVIVFTSYMIIQFVMDALGIEAAKGGLWSVSDWFK